MKGFTEKTWRHTGAGCRLSLTDPLSLFLLTVLAASSLLACRTGEPSLDHGSTKLDSVAAAVVSFTTSDGGLIYADLYGKGGRAVVLAHGRRFTSVIGASFGGWAAAKASVLATPNEIDKLVLMAHSPIEHPERMKGRLLFITTRDDFSGNHVLRLPGIRKQFERAPEPKELVILEGSTHAQHIFKTKQGARLMREILRFLAKP